jgi:hypothetical protein
MRSIYLQVHATDSIDPLIQLLESKYSKYADVWYVVATPSVISAIFLLPDP